MNKKVSAMSYNDLHEISWKQGVMEGAERLGVSPALISIQQGSYPKSGIIDFWEDPLFSDSDEAQSNNNMNLVKYSSILSSLSSSIAASFQFPVNTIFAHGLGVIASAMSKSFKFQYGGGEKPVNLYVVTAQPPSTGKSGVNELLSEPVHLAFDAINKTATANRKKAKIRIAAIKKQIKEAKHEEEMMRFEEELTKLYKEHDKHTVYTYSVDDPTPEGLAKLAHKQDGLFNIISAEADAINIILGNVYSDKKANHGLFLKGWDAERMSIVRSSQENLSFKAVGNIAVIAQDESIKTILAAGESGRGISERFLLLREPTLLGTRTFGDYISVDDELLGEYNRMIMNIVRDSNVVLKFTSKSINMINNYRKEVEPEMGDNGMYSNNMMRGFIGKADKQIMKLASILHVIENWVDDGNRERDISHNTVLMALDLFKQIVISYTTTADGLGFTGLDSEYKKVEERLVAYAEKGKLVISVNQLRSNLKGVKPFSGTPNLTNKLKNVLLPTLGDNNICIVHDNKIYINPKVKG